MGDRDGPVHVEDHGGHAVGQGDRQRDRVRQQDLHSLIPSSPTRCTTCTHQYPIAPSTIPATHTSANRGSGDRSARNATPTPSNPASHAMVPARNNALTFTRAGLSSGGLGWGSVTE